MILWFLVLSLIGGIHITMGCDSTTSELLQVNVLVGKDGASAFQCWAVEPPLVISQQPGTVGAKFFSLGNSTLGTIVFFNETNDVNAGLHRAPQSQWVVVIKGSGIVSLPTTNETLALPQGDIIIANDTAEVSKLGHNTRWDAGTVVIELPFQDGVIPSHTVINPSGHCHASHHPHDHHD